MTTQDIKPGYKQSPLGLIPGDWEVYRLKDLFTFHKGQGLSKDILDENGAHECILYGELYTHYKQVINDTVSKTDSEEGVKSINGDILIPASTTTSAYDLVTASVVKKDNVLLGGDINILRKKKKLNGEFFANYLTYNKKKEISKYGQGITIIHLYATSFSDIFVHFPPLPEQQSIANILGKVDETIEKTQSMIEKLELRNKGLEQKLLKNNNRKEIKLGNLFERVTDKNSEGNTNVVTISAQKGFIKQNDFFNKFVASETLDNYYLVKKGEFCYNKSYSNGYPMGAIKRLNDFDKAVVTTLYICFKIKDLNKTSGDFFEYYFDAGLLDKGLTQIAYEGGRAHGLLNVSQNDFFNLKIRVPEIEEQKAIANILNKANEQLNKYEQKLEKLQELKKGLMQQLLTGKVRVKEFRN